MPFQCKRLHKDKSKTSLSPIINKVNSMVPLEEGAGLMEQLNSE